MTFKQQDWNGPNKIVTPNIEEDIEKFLGEKIIEAYKKCANQEYKEKIQFITERLEFIEGMKIFANYIRKTSRHQIKKIDHGITDTFKNNFLNYDFAGFDYDIEALNYYLYLSCIDAIQSQPNFIKTFDWIKENAIRFENKSESELVSILEEADKEYSETYGVNKNFKKAFTDDITESLKEELCESLMVVKIKNAKITDDSVDAWKNRDLDAKLSKIATTLYNQRSKYTHENIRSFLPSSSLTTMPKNEGEYLLCKKDKQIDSLLLKVIKDVCLKKLG